MKTTVIEFVKKGEPFRVPDKKPVYVRAGYNPVLKRFIAYKFDDVNSYRLLRKGTTVETGFDF